MHVTQESCRDVVMDDQLILMLALSIQRTVVNEQIFPLCFCPSGYAHNITTAMRTSIDPGLGFLAPYIDVSSAIVVVHERIWCVPGSQNVSWDQRPRVF